MSRFKEQRRIDLAFKHNNHQELEWALSYVRSRLQYSTLKSHKKHWQNLEKKILEKLQ